MSDLWNDSSLQPPPINTSIFSYNIDTQDLINTCNNIQKVLLKQSPLHKECAILSRFIYKFDKKFRNDIGYRYLKKVNTALHKYLTLNLSKDVETFTSVLPRNKGENYLPTRQMLEYLLIHIISFSKIMMRICVCSKQAAVHYMDRVKRGQSHWMSLMPFALLSRIWSFSLVLLQHSCSWYTCLYPYLNKLKPKGLEFLPRDYSLPPVLESLLDLTNIDDYGRFEWACKKSVQITLDFTEDDDIDLDSILDYIKEVNEDDELVSNDESLITSKPLQLSANVTLKSVDEGQSISREYFQQFFNQTNNDSKSKKHSTDDVTSITTLNLFIDKEDTLRNNNSPQSLTKHLSFMQWQSLKMSLQKLCNSLSNNRKVERKFQKIWQDKCLDYVIT